MKADVARRLASDRVIEGVAWFGLDAPFAATVLAPGLIGAACV
jgi:hypothetical protein